jgi:hypothetical protein
MPACILTAYLAMAAKHKRNDPPRTARNILSCWMNMHLLWRSPQA